MLFRLAGFVQIIKTDCNEDPRNAEFNLSLKWPSWAHPFTLLILYNLLVYEAKTLLTSSKVSKPIFSSKKYFYLNYDDT